MLALVYLISPSCEGRGDIYKVQGSGKVFKKPTHLTSTTGEITSLPRNILIFTSAIKKIQIKISLIQTFKEPFSRQRSPFLPLSTSGSHVLWNTGPDFWMILLPCLKWRWHAGRKCGSWFGWPSAIIPGAVCSIGFAAADISRLVAFLKGLDPVEGHQSPRRKPGIFKKEIFGSCECNLKRTGEPWSTHWFQGLAIWGGLMGREEASAIAGWTLKISLL